MTLHDVPLSDLTIEQVQNLRSIAEVHEALRQTQRDEELLHAHLEQCLRSRDRVDARLELIDMVPYVLGALLAFVSVCERVCVCGEGY